MTIFLGGFCGCVCVCILTASALPFSVKYLYQPQKSEFCLYQLMFLRLRISLRCDSATAAISLILSPPEALKGERKRHF